MHLTTDPKNPRRLLDENGLFVAEIGNAEDAAAVVLACNTHSRLVTALAQCMNFIEHKCANEGQATTKEEWARNVERFRRDVGKVGIGRSYTDEAVVDLRAARAVLDEVKTFSGGAPRTLEGGTAAGGCAPPPSVTIDGKYQVGYTVLVGAMLRCRSNRPAGVSRRQRTGRRQPSPPGAEIMTEHTATYSPEDNKLRLYPASKLDPSTYARVKEAGFQWAPKQRLFVAPAWTPAREDLLLELCGEVGDEDTSLVDRAEERAERFSERSDNHAEEADAARRGAAAIAGRIPFGQPILVGHHSERRARKDAERIENGMRKAVSMWASAEYWGKRAAAALRHAKHKERPDVRARRIKSLDADKRKQERAREEALYWLEWWSADGLTEQHAVTLASRCNLRLPRKDGDSEDLHSGPSGYDALTNGHPSLYVPRTLAEIVETAKKQYQDTAAWTQRWIDHYANRLAYERAMLAERGGLIAETVDLQPGGRVLVRGEWLTILRVTRRDGKALSVTTDARGVAVRPVDEITDYQAPTAATTAAAAAATATAPLANYERADFVRITRAEYQAVPSDYRGHKAIAAAGIHGAHRVRYVLGAFLTAEQRGQRPRHDSYFVFITDDKRKDPPASAQQLATPVPAAD